jgi:peptide/nickel transport system permease protein
MAPVIIIFSINIGGVIISAASLSFLGYGLPPAFPDWGAMLSREGRQYMEMAPRLALWPGLCLTIVVYSLNMFGDALRDLLDPRLRGGEGSYGIAKVKRKRGLLDRLISPFNW